VSGQLGNNSTANQLAPVTAFGLTGIRQIAAGGNHTLARIATSGSLRAWGLNTYGQVGDDTTTNRLIRVAVKGLS
jgi:alpha-tubulin suppressor-like RCC1 family protein